MLDLIDKGVVEYAFVRCLVQAQQEDTNYDVRNPLILQALGFAAALGLPCGVRLDPQEPDWPVVYIELPTGQVSWHLPQYPETFDGHTTEQKFARIQALTQQFVDHEWGTGDVTG